MPTYYNIRVNDRELQAFFDYAGYKARDLREPFRRIAFGVLLPGLHEQFATEGARTGGWVPLTEKYAQWKTFRVGFKPMLELTGDGKKAALDPKAFKIHRHSLEYDPNVPEYMAYHQTGDDDLPPRPWLVVTEGDEQEMEAIFEEWLDDLRTFNRARGSASRFVGPIPQGWTLI